MQTFLKSKNEQQQYACIKHIHNRSRFIFFKINITSLAAMMGNSSAVNIAFQKGFVDMDALDGESLLDIAQENK